MIRITKLWTKSSLFRVWKAAGNSSFFAAISHLPNSHTHTPQRKSKFKTLDANESQLCIWEPLQFINTSEENSNKIYQGLAFSGGEGLPRSLHVADIKETQGSAWRRVAQAQMILKE